MQWLNSVPSSWGVDIIFLTKDTFAPSANFSTTDSVLRVSRGSRKKNDTEMNDWKFPRTYASLNFPQRVGKLWEQLSTSWRSEFDDFALIGFDFELDRMLHTWSCSKELSLAYPSLKSFHLTNPGWNPFTTFFKSPNLRPNTSSRSFVFLLDYLFVLKTSIQVLNVAKKLLCLLHVHRSQRIAKFPQTKGFQVINVSVIKLRSGNKNFLMN